MSSPVNYTSASSGILAETVASKTDQPALAFVRVVIGTSTEITTLPPKCVQSFEINRLNGQGQEFTITLFDDNWEEIESQLSAHLGKVIISYGYVGGRVTTLTAELLDYSMEFTGTGTILICNGVAESVVANLASMTMDVGTLNPTAAVEKICREQGWKIGTMDPSNDIDASNRDSFALIGDHPLQYITSTLAPLAVRSSDGVSGYRFYLDESEDPPIAHFRPADIHENSERTYIYMRGIDSSVISLQMNVNGIFGATGSSLVTTNLTSSFIDPETKDLINIDKDINSSRVYATGIYTHTKSGVSEASVDAAGGNSSQMNALLNYRVTPGASSDGAYPYDGILQIVGDPDLTIDSTIRVVVVTDSGHLHHTSGLYRIETITDTISNGFYVTTLSIWKSENLDGGLEILNPRVVLK